MTIRENNFAEFRVQKGFLRDAYEIRNRITFSNFDVQTRFRVNLSVVEDFLKLHVEPNTIYAEKLSCKLVSD